MERDVWKKGKISISIKKSSISRSFDTMFTAILESTFGVPLVLEILSDWRWFGFETKDTLFLMFKLQTGQNINTEKYARKHSKSMSPLKRKYTNIRWTRIIYNILSFLRTKKTKKCKQVNTKFEFDKLRFNLLSFLWNSIRMKQRGKFFSGSTTL